MSKEARSKVHINKVENIHKALKSDVRQTHINTCRVSELNKQNLYFIILNRRTNFLATIIELICFLNCKLQSLKSIEQFLNRKQRNFMIQPSLRSKVSNTSINNHFDTLSNHPVRIICKIFAQKNFKPNYI